MAISNRMAASTFKNIYRGAFEATVLRERTVGFFKTSTYVRWGPNVSLKLQFFEFLFGRNIQKLRQKAYTFESSNKSYSGHAFPLVKAGVLTLADLLTKLL
jgi:hypothetical protein